MTEALRTGQTDPGKVALTIVKWSEGRLTSEIALTIRQALIDAYERGYSDGRNNRPPGETP